MKQASEELGVKEEVIRRDLGHVLLQLRELQDEQIKKALDPKPEETPMSEEEKTAALACCAIRTCWTASSQTSSGAAWSARRPTSCVGYLAAVSRLARIAARHHSCNPVSAAGKVVAHGSGARLRARRAAGAVLGHDRPIALLHGRDRS